MHLVDKKWLLRFFLLLIRPIFSDDTISETPTAGSPAAGIPQETVDYDSSSGIRAIYLTGKSENLIPSGRSGMNGIWIEDLELPGKSPDNVNALKAILQPYLGKKYNVTTALEIKE